MVAVMSSKPFLSAVSLAGGVSHGFRNLFCSCVSSLLHGTHWSEKVCYMLLLLGPVCGHWYHALERRRHGHPNKQNEQRSGQRHFLGNSQGERAFPIRQPSAISSLNFFAYYIYRQTNTNYQQGCIRRIFLASHFADFPSWRSRFSCSTSRRPSWPHSLRSLTRRRGPSCFTSSLPLSREAKGF